MSTGKYSSQNPRFNHGGQQQQQQASTWARGPTRWEATGANGTPLGTPTRMSPFVYSDPETASKDVVKPEEGKKEKEKRKTGDVVSDSLECVFGGLC